jgi:hypothetical protein
MCLGHESLSFSELVRVPWRVDRTFKDRRAGPGQGTAREAQPTRDDVSKLLFSPVCTENLIALRGRANRVS